MDADTFADEGEILVQKLTDDIAAVKVSPFLFVAYIRADSNCT